MRSTQRAPRSCTACSRRKIKCDKTVPCQQCVARSEARECRREVVKVRGHIRAGEPGDSGSRYEDVLQENARLRALLARGSTEQAPTADMEDAGPQTISSRSEALERRLFEDVSRLSRPRVVVTEHDIAMPPRDLSDAIVKHAFEWTFWVHYALIIPEFDREHREFWDRFADTKSFSGIDPSWLATYFSVLASNLLFMDDKDTVCVRPEGMGVMDLLRNWYDAALSFLDRADFMQNPSIHSVRSIAILGIVFNHVGDVRRHSNLWSVAIRQAQQLRMGTDSGHENETYTQQQARRRLWWTLVLCDWIPVPFRSPCINEIDFNCQIPDEVDDDELLSSSGPSRLSRSKPRPIRYHIAMINISKIYYQIRYKLRLRNWAASEVAEFVFAADEQLANLISDLPAYLRFDEVATDTTRQRDLQNPFIPWQKESLSMVLLYYRMAISRLLQVHWLDNSITGARTRAICMSSAQGLINSTLSHTSHASKMRTWYDDLS
ncbi:hypothetical protein GQ53DRAFT_837454 [Thozetella sp. PMI_491]|nr:hypothetical protein GQ53DRAFT_837454 [Thozetella sp. PMI_491]